MRRLTHKRSRKSGLPPGTPVHIGERKAGAARVGKTLAEKAKAAGITKVAMDRNGFKFHGRIKALADAARENGLEF